MKRLSGLKLLEEREGTGREARQGDQVIYNTRTFLNKGEEVKIQKEQIRYLTEEVIRVVDNATLVDHIPGRWPPDGGWSGTWADRHESRRFPEGSYHPTSGLSRQRRRWIYSG